jgi:hypothetical protein
LEKEIQILANNKDVKGVLINVLKPPYFITRHWIPFGKLHLYETIIINSLNHHLQYYLHAPKSLLDKDAEQWRCLTEQTCANLYLQRDKVIQQDSQDLRFEVSITLNKQNGAKSDLVALVANLGTVTAAKYSVIALLRKPLLWLLSLFPFAFLKRIIHFLPIF